LLKKYLDLSFKKIKSRPIFYSLLLLSLIIICAFAYYILDFWGKERLLRMGADEPVWVDRAIKAFQEGKGSPYAHVPLFHDMIVPFVSGILFSFETGYIIWKVLLFVVSSVLFFYIFSKLSNIWVGLIFTVHYELMANYVAFPTYSVLAMIFFLAAISVIVSNKNNLGLAFGLLMLGGMVRLELTLFGIVFFLLAIVFFTKLVFSKKFLRQISIPIAIFIFLIYWHGSSIISLPKDFMYRGNQSSVWYVIDYMYYEGYFDKYNVPDRGSIPMDVLDKVLVENFGMGLLELDDSSFIEMYKANPKLINARYMKMLTELPDLLTGNFKVQFSKDGPPGFYLVRFLIPLILPFLYLLFKMKYSRIKESTNISKAYNSFINANKKISGPLIILILSSFAGFIPWMMTKPVEHYTIMILPTFYIIMIIVVNLVFNLCNRFSGIKIVPEG
jgi:hypothetical protein